MVGAALGKLMAEGRLAPGRKAAPANSPIACGQLRQSLAGLPLCRIQRR
ncbi:hypothetical protein [Duganella sp. LjRoot269]|jgi:hypothetical protein